MVNFRKMRIGDLDVIYRDEELRPLITVPPKGRKFAVIIEEDGLILGGASGYLEEKSAFIQCSVLKSMEHGNLYKDGLIRSLIHFLELDGAEFLLVRGNDLLYRDIGFARMPPETNGTERFGEMIREEIRRGDVLWINLQQFFQKQA